MNTLRGGLSDLVNTLNKLRNNTTDAKQQLALQKILRLLFALWEEVIAQEINSNTPDYQNALAALGTAEKTAQDAIQDLKKVAGAIETAVKAAKAVDKVVKLVADALG